MVKKTKNNKENIMNIDDEDFGLDKDSELYKILKILQDRENLGEESEEEMEKLFELASDPSNLGAPDKVDVHEDGKLIITVKFWYVPGGEITSVDVEGNDGSVTDEEIQNKIAQIIDKNGEYEPVEVNFGDKNLFNVNNPIETKKTMEESLDEAVEKEDYVLAAKIRDAIQERDDLINSLIQDINNHIEKGEYDSAKVLLDKIKALRESKFDYGEKN